MWTLFKEPIRARKLIKTDSDFPFHPRSGPIEPKITMKLKPINQKIPPEILSREEDSKLPGNQNKD